MKLNIGQNILFIAIFFSKGNPLATSDNKFLLKLRQIQLFYNPRYESPDS